MDMYESKVKSIVYRFCGYREKDVLNAPHTIKKSETWNKDHKIINISKQEAEPDGHKDSFSIDLVSGKICG